MYFCVVPENRQALPGIPDVKTIGILTNICNTIDTKEVDEAEIHRTNTANSQDSTSEQ